MGWLKGSTDIANFRADLYSLLTGGMAAGSRGTGQAGNGVTLSTADRWTGIDATNYVIRSEKVESGFAGEYALWRGAPRFGARSTATVMTPLSVARVGRPTFTGTYSGGTARAYFACYVSTANTSPGALAGTVVTWTLVNAVTGATVSSGTASGWTGSTFTVLLTAGISLTLTLAAGESFVAGANAIMWLRAYTTTYTDGIDYFPEAAKIKSGTLVLATSSGGANAYTAATDYDLVQEAHQFPAQNTTLGVFSLERDWGSTGAGCGIHWKTAGAPPAVGVSYYAHSFQLYAGYLCVPTLAAATNYLLTGGPAEYWDGTLGVGRGVYHTAAGGTTLPGTAAPSGILFTGVTQPTTTFINFWITCREDLIVLVLRGDPGQGGRLCVLTLQRYTPLVTTDKWPWVYIVDASAGRSSSFLVTGKHIYENPYWGVPSQAVTPISSPFWYSSSLATSTYGVVLAGINGVNSSGVVGGIPTNNPNSWDMRWWLFTLYLATTRGGGNLSGVFDPAKQGGIRGKLRDIYGIGEDNFTSLDELVDGTSTYLLVSPTNDWNPSVGNAYSSVAVLEG